MHIIAVMSAVAALASAQPAAQITDIRMHLFYRLSGRLSDDISPPHQFTGWNTVIGEGDAEAPAEDLLVVVEMRGGSGEEYVETPLRVVARGRDNRVIADRRFDSLLSSERGTSYSPVWLQDVPCEGEIRVTATFGGQSVSESLSLECGE
jgi:hypothetical protein